MPICIHRSSSMILRPVLVVIALFSHAAATAAGNTPGKVIAGWVENVTLIDADNAVVKAKLDTGAKSSSIDARNIEVYRQNGLRRVKFDLAIRSRGELTLKPFDLPQERRVRIKEHDGDHESRPVVSMNLCFDGKPRRAQFTLTNRATFLYPVLLGRRFLQGVAVVDPEQTFNLRARCSE